MHCPLAIPAELAIACTWEARETHTRRAHTRSVEFTQLPVVWSWRDEEAGLGPAHNKSSVAWRSSRRRRTVDTRWLAADDTQTAVRREKGATRQEMRRGGLLFFVGNIRLVVDFISVLIGTLQPNPYPNAVHISDLDSHSDVTHVLNY